MSEIKLLYVDESHMRVVTDAGTFHDMRDYFKYHPDNYQFMPKFKHGGWDGYIYFLDYNGFIPCGLLTFVKKFAENFGHDIVIDPRLVPEQEMSREKFDEWVNGFELTNEKKEPIQAYWYQKDSVFQIINNKKSLIELGTSGGKAQPMYSKILTPDGWKTMGDMKIGTKILTPNGNISRVTHIHPQGIKDVYQITFSDGRQTECCKDHLWKVFIKNKWSVMSLEEIMIRQKTQRVYIELPVVEYEEKYFDIKPYTLGALIGDGCFHNSITITSMDEYIPNKILNEINQVYSDINYRVSCKPDNKAKTYTLRSSTGRMGGVLLENRKYIDICKFKDDIEKLGLLKSTSYTKFIPDVYKYGSIEQRKEILRGLIDTDGYVSKTGKVEYGTTSIRLANDVVDIVRSIGGHCHIREKKTKSNFGIFYNVIISYHSPYELVSLERKRKRLIDIKNNRIFASRYRNLSIKKIEKTTSQICQCITIDSKEQLYVTDNYIVTHNSLIGGLLSRFFLENFEGKVLVIVPTIVLVRQMQSDFITYGLFTSGSLTGVSSNDYFRNEALVHVSTWQSASKKPPEYFKQFGMVIVDECHKATADVITGIITNMKHCLYKVGMTGTLKDGKAKLMQYVSLFGDVYKPVETHQLMESGEVTKLIIKSIFLRYDDDEIKYIHSKILDMNGEPLTNVTNEYYQREIEFIHTHLKRNHFVCSLAERLITKDENVLLLFLNKKHGKSLYESLKATSKNPDMVFYMDGNTKATERDAIKAILENNTGVILVASYGILSTGVSIRNIHHVILGHPTKSKITVIQSIGRVLRLHESKEFAMCWDIVDDLSKMKRNGDYGTLNYCVDFGLKRIEHYNNEKYDYTIYKKSL